jgi:hypothetical protein
MSMPSRIAVRRKIALVEAMEPRVLMSAATQLVITGQPGGVTAGSADALTVSFEDAGGTIDSSQTAQVTLTIANGPSGAALGGTATATASGGVATFNNVVLTKAGPYTLTAAASGMTSATTASFAVSAAAYSQMIFSQEPPSTLAAGQSLAGIVVTAVDAYGNPSSARDGDVIEAWDQIGGPYTMNGQSMGSLTLTGGEGNFGAVTLDSAATLNQIEVYDESLMVNYNYYTIDSSNFSVVAAAPARLVVTSQPQSAVAGALISQVAVAVEDAYGNVNLTDTSDVTLSTGTSPAGTAFGGTHTAAAAGGVATFSDLTLTKDGTNTLVATDGVLASTTTTSFTISSASGTQLVFTSLPALTTAGQDLAGLQLTLEDPFGNTATNLNGSAVNVATDNGATYSAGLVNGVATYTAVELGRAGTHTLTASYSSLGLVTQSQPFTIAPAAASSLQFGLNIGASAAGTVIHGVTVSVVDEFGNVVTADQSPVTVALFGEPTTLDGTKTVAAHDGVAVFSNLSITKSGAYALQASDGSLEGGISGLFTVTPGAAAKLVLVNEPQASQVAGAALSQLDLVPQDAYGNIVASDSSTVTVASTLAPVGASVGGTTTAVFNTGSAQFTQAKLARVGTYTLTFSDGSMTPVTTSSFTITPGAPAQLVFDRPPADVTAGQAMSAVTVEVDDAFGNLVTTADTTVLLTLASNPGGAAVTGDLVATAEDGLAAFTGLQLTRAGNYALAAVGGQGVQWAVSPAFAVFAGAAARLVVTSQPDTATAGELLAPVVVDVDDAWGNLVSTDSSTVTITSAITPAGAAAGGTMTGAAVGGVATFSDLSAPTAGSYLFSTGDAGLSPAFTSPITVSGQVAPVVPVKPVTPVSPVTPALPTIAAGAVMSRWSVPVTAPSAGRTTSAAVSITSGPAGAKLRGRATVRTKTGSVSFTGLSIGTAGQYTIAVTAADGTVTTRTLVVTPGTAVHAKFAGTPAAPAVTLTDRFGNVVSDGTAVTLTLASATRGVTLAVQSVTTTGGVATFPAPTVLAAGRYRLVVTSGKMLRVASSWFTVA